MATTAARIDQGRGADGARGVEGLRPAVEEIVAQACEQVAGESDFAATFAFPLPVTVIGELLSIPASDRPMFQSLARDWMALATEQQVMTLIGAANRDPAVFSQPDKLILDRAQQAPLSFGGGIHYCLGAPLARLEAQVAFPALLNRFPGLALAGEPVSREGITLHGHTSLPISAR